MENVRTAAERSSRQRLVQWKIVATDIVVAAGPPESQQSDYPEDQLERMAGRGSRAPEALETRIGTLGADLSLLRNDHRRLAERVTTMKREVAEQTTAVVDLTNRRTAMEGKVKTLELRAEDAEKKMLPR
ncbi:hypothetical protein NDU88_008161 [Pleurodeles waltl]|uniref:Uncharacterized protein n=1 Tax=Pleurodeles waltl TaxID=8319 RepID=A0AAV7RSD3_PLEWA|nr:hypothetical protein NDU88_008161 [Pleurodeles waltl]